ncbi:MAG: 50S ribosomal protein L10 [Parvibaculum sp.]|uniref:50S ribosomal protein L10 n=1 Tax=Parvibaculum sp. TaxID=2024848 RepID=UPI0025DCF069|nr:50S ribosomal protein L10 [Parvibaculum sp.]MCE9647990.1 50S ribosomal protein L10 [Parvibaculum sp.]
MDRAEKSELLTHLNGVFANANVVVVAHYSGLTVTELTDLRSRMAKVGAEFKVTKNRIAKLALDGTKAQKIADLFAGPTAIAYSQDPVAAPKVAVEFAKANQKLVILGGAMGETLLDVNAVKTLAELPSLDELRAKLLGMIQTPATRIAGVVAAPASQLARVLNAYATKGEAA